MRYINELEGYQNNIRTQPIIKAVSSYNKINPQSAAAPVTVVQVDQTKQPGFFGQFGQALFNPPRPLPKQNQTQAQEPSNPKNTRTLGQKMTNRLTRKNRKPAALPTTTLETLPHFNLAGYNSRKENPFLHGVGVASPATSSFPAPVVGVQQPQTLSPVSSGFPAFAATAAAAQAAVNAETAKQQKATEAAATIFERGAPSTETAVPGPLTFSSLPAKPSSRKLTFSSLPAKPSSRKLAFKTGPPRPQDYTQSNGGRRITPRKHKKSARKTRRRN
jgi:hypothetical protein